LVIGNVVKRILFLIREEQALSVDEKQEEEERKLQELHDVFAIEDFKMKSTCVPKH
jgi:predicted transcriptional regulator